MIFLADILPGLPCLTLSLLLTGIDFRRLRLGYLTDGGSLSSGIILASMISSFLEASTSDFVCLASSGIKGESGTTNS